MFLCLFINGIFAQVNNPDNSSSQEGIITIDFSKIKGPMNTMFRECVGAGRANEGLRADLAAITCLC